MKYTNNHKHWARTLLMGTSAVAMSSAVLAPAMAQEDGAADSGQDTIVVTGIRGSLTSSMNTKRNAEGVVDAISAEDIGKFPDTNLAESLQRITGVSIDRVNGEGSEVTVRGFGGGFNLVTLNGRSMPSANIGVVGGDQEADDSRATSRSFDFSNLASEGVAGLEVYKTGRADAPTGGIGATINIKTNRPLERPGFRATVAAKGLHDTSVIRGDDFTPEASGLMSWTDDNEKFGVSLFGSYQKRESGVASATSNNWNIVSYDDFFGPTGDSSPFITPSTVIVNRPNQDALISVPNDSRLHASDFVRERLNAQLVLQFRPLENLTFTGDFTYANNESEEQRADQTNWFSRPFDEVRFDANPVVATTVFLSETNTGGRDFGHEQQYRAEKDTLESFGFNAEWDVSDTFKLVLDGHSSKAESLPNNPNGFSSTQISIAAPVTASSSVDYSSGFPFRTRVIDDSIRANGNGVLDVGDLGSQPARQNRSIQLSEVDEIRLDGSWDMIENGTFNFGGSYRKSEMTQSRQRFQQTLGNWGVNNPGDVEQFAPGVVEEYCLNCLFDDFNAGPDNIAFRGDATQLFNALSTSPLYSGQEIRTTTDEFNLVEEEVISVYGQVSVDTVLLGRPAHILAGVRYEDTQTTSTSVVTELTAIQWDSDNDFTEVAGTASTSLVDSGDYSNLLPSFDLSVDVTDDLVVRASFSKTIARPDFSNLFSALSVNRPSRPTALGGIATGSSGDPNLRPLESDNFDISVEWYYDDASYISIGAFEKRVSNFIGTGTETRNAFGLRDASSGAAGSRSGEALAELDNLGALPTDTNLFTLTALLEQTGDLATASSMFQANLLANGNVDEQYAETVFSSISLVGDANDPLYDFQVQIPINNREGNISGLEFAAQHFFGDTGFGIAANYTLVNGDVGIDVGASPNEDQFALLGLSDSANVVGIYEKGRISARVAWNWRDEFLIQTNRGGFRNPVFVDAYDQFDVSVSYNVTDNINLTFEGINLGGSTTRTFGRDESNLWLAQELKPRYLLGARYTF